MIASRYPAETREWMNEILFTVCVDVSVSGMPLCLSGSQDDFVQSKATPEAKRAFVKAVVGWVLVYPSARSC